MIPRSARGTFRERAEKVLEEIRKKLDLILVIHYSCETFYERTDGTSPRITSIAVRDLVSGATHSFSIHLVAERDKVAFSQIESNYDKLEGKMLSDFYKFMKDNKERLWIHWNMRDSNYGFPALAHRYRVVMHGQAFELPSANLVDFSRLLVWLFGNKYIGHPRLFALAELNRISLKDTLSGDEEATAFSNKSFVKLHQSTLKKVDLIANIVERTLKCELATRANIKDIYGSYGMWLQDKIRKNIAWAVVSIIAAIASITSLVFVFVPVRGCTNSEATTTQQITPANSENDGHKSKNIHNEMPH
jgi:hypothetical protein